MYIYTHMCFVYVYETFTNRNNLDLFYVTWRWLRRIQQKSNNGHRSPYVWCHE